MSDINVTIGADSSGFQAGMAAIRNESQKVGSAITKDLTGFFSPAALASAALTAGFAKILESAHAIHHESERFGVDAAQLQLIANAAKEDGISLELTARALNQLTINAEKGLNPISEQHKALQQLGVDASYFAQLNADQKFLALSDAYAASAHTGADYAAVATLIGKRNTEMIPILDKGSAAIKKQGEAMGIISSENIKLIDEMYKALKIAGGQFEVLGAQGVGALGKLDQWLLKVRQSAIDLRNSLFHVTGQGAIPSGFGSAPAASQAIGANVATQEALNTATEEYISLSDREVEILEKENEVRLAGLDHQSKLLELTGDLTHLQDQLNAEIASEGDHTERALDLREQIADTTRAILPLEAELSREKAKQADEAERAAEAAEKQAAADQRDAETAARKAEADRLENNRQVEDQIRNAAGALAFYNLRLGDASKLPNYFTTTGQDVTHGQGTLLTGPALQLWNYISTLEDRLFAPNAGPGQQQDALAQIMATIPLLKAQLGLLQSINTNLTPRPGGI